MEAARRQCLLDKETACGVIILWLRHHRLFSQLARQTLRRLQHEAALARMQHEQECCAHALQAEEQRQQAATARAKAIADGATARHRQAKEKRRRAALAKAKRHENTLATEEHQRAALATAKHVAAARAAEALSLIEESRRHKALLAAEANNRRCHKVAARTVESEALTLVEGRRHHEAETWVSLSMVSPLADK